MQQSAKPLPVTIRSAIARAFIACGPTLPVRLEVKSHSNKQLSLTLHQGPFSKVLLRLHKELHKVFYQVVKAAKRLLANLISALTPAPALSATIALLPATCASSSVTAAPAPASGSQLWRTMSNPVGSIDTPLSRWEARQIKTQQMALAGHAQRRSVPRTVGRTHGIAGRATCSARDCRPGC